MKIGFVGTGQMAQALAIGIVSQYKPEVLAAKGQVEFWISDPNADAAATFQSCLDGRAAVHQVKTNSDVIRNARIVFIAVKPQYLEEALGHTETAFADNPEVVLISIVAGVTISQLRRRTGAAKIIRAMPNTPCLIGRGAIGVSASEETGAKDLAMTVELLKCVGSVHEISEENLDAVTGLSGSGPAYVFTFIEALSDGGVLNGLSREVATKLALQTVIGAAELMDKSGEHPAVLRDRVTSPGGTTIAGLKALEELGFRDAVMSAVSAATRRSIELGE